MLIHVSEVSRLILQLESRDNRVSSRFLAIEESEDHFEFFH